MSTNSDTEVTWRDIREDLRSLPPGEWSLFWSSCSQPRWTWFRPTDDNLRARVTAICLKAAKKRGYKHEEQLYDEISYADFVRFWPDCTPGGPYILPGSTHAETESGLLKNVVEYLITLCDQLEAGDVPKPIITRLPYEAIARMEAATAVFMGDWSQRLHAHLFGTKQEPHRLLRQVFMARSRLREPHRQMHQVFMAKRREPPQRITQARLLRGMVVHHFQTVAREYRVLCTSAEEFEASLRAGIARFVKTRVAPHSLRLGRAMRDELVLGFQIFLAGRDPWPGIAATERYSTWPPGALCAEALTYTANQLIAEAVVSAVELRRQAEPESVGRPLLGDAPAREVARPSTGRKPKRIGRFPKADFNRGVVAVVDSFNFGDSWPEHLAVISEELDKHSELPVSEIRSKKWKAWDSWSEVFLEDPEGLRKALEYRIAWVRKHPLDVAK